jgi:hypothetical protein
LLAVAGTMNAQEGVEEVVELSAFPVVAGSFTERADPAVQLSDRMAREVRVDLQTRGGNRYQTDISIRGGIFEGTGLMVGGLALFDPQTGHYFSEIPLDPAFFGGAYLLTGVENGIHGFNSTAGSIDWQWGALVEGGSVYGRVGTDSLIGGGARVAAMAGDVGYEVSVTHEQGDGSVEFGDFELTRISGRVETPLAGGQLRLFGGFLDKFYGWPRMYTGFPLNETDDYTVHLLGWQWESGESGNGSSHRIGGYWREVDDDYEFSRSSPNNFFEHKTKVLSLQGDGTVAMEAIDLVYRWSILKDEVLRSTSLTNGDFSERRYGEAAVLARRTWETDKADWSVYGGGALDTTNEDSTVGLPQAGISAAGTSWRAYLEYSETSQVPGYTVLKSGPSGLFGGNASLGRELAETIEAGYAFEKDAFSGKVVLFQRDDTNLVDWVYASDSPNARQAAPVDIKVRGIEGWLRWDNGSTALEFGYAWLDKDEDYKDSSVDASFYALNYARHRLLATVEQALSDSVFLRLEGEFRDHPDNALRTSDNEAFLLSFEAIWKDALGAGWDVVFRADNLTDEDFQMIPGTPGPGREAYVTLSYGW